MAFCYLIVCHLNSSSQFWKNHHLYIFILDKHGLIVLINLLIAYRLDHGIRIYPTARTLIHTFLQEYRVLFRLTHLIGRNSHNFSPSSYHIFLFFLILFCFFFSLFSLLFSYCLFALFFILFLIPQNHPHVLSFLLPPSSFLLPRETTLLIPHQLPFQFFKALPLCLRTVAQQEQECTDAYPAIDPESTAAA